jgi:hypothetical protein
MRVKAALMGTFCGALWGYWLGFAPQIFDGDQGWIEILVEDAAFFGH